MLIYTKKKKAYWDFDWDNIESIYQHRENRHFYNIEFSGSCHGLSLHFFRSHFNFSQNVCHFQNMCKTLSYTYFVKFNHKHFMSSNIIVNSLSNSLLLVYINTIYFYILTLCLATLLNLLVLVAFFLFCRFLRIWYVHNHIIFKENFPSFF